MDIEREFRPAPEVATELYQKIGVICAGEVAIVDGLNGSAVAVGKTKLFHVTVRSQMEEWKGVRKVWHVAVLVSRKTVGEEYICRISEDGEVRYNDTENFATTRLDMERQDSQDYVESFVRQLDEAVFEQNI